MEQVEQLFKDKKIELGEATLSKFTLKGEEQKMQNMQALFAGNYGDRISEGTYIRLHVGTQLVMSDTDMEQNTNWEFCRRANGRVLIAGLGVGLILHNIKEKFDKGEITEVTVIEKSQDVIDLVSPIFPWVKCIQMDVLEFKPPTSEKWDTIYFDIWPDRDTDNLDEIKKLHNIFKFRLNRENPNCWMNSWYKEQLQAMKREDNRQGYW